VFPSIPKGDIVGKLFFIDVNFEEVYKNPRGVVMKPKFFDEKERRKL
jgi:hypothetical protein